MAEKIKYLYGFSINKADPKTRVGKTFLASESKLANSWVNRKGFHGYVENIRYLKRSSELKIQDLWILQNPDVSYFFHRNFYTISIVIDNYKGNQPYHDLNHLIGVGFLTEKLISLTDTLRIPELRTHEKSLVLAGLLHDFNHKGP